MITPELVIAIQAKVKEKLAQYGPYPDEVLRGASLVAVEAYEALEQAIIYTSPSRGKELQTLQNLRCELVDVIAAAVMYYEQITKKLETECKRKFQSS